MIINANTQKSCHCSNSNLLDNWYFAGPINQRGVSGTITALGYFIDRWKLISGTVELTADGLILNGTMAQILEAAPAGIVKASVLTTAGIVPASYNASGKTLTIEGTGQTFVAAKLEQGTVQTLAHQDADGNWVLNDPPPNKALELVKCQRYFIRFTRRTHNFCMGLATGSTVILAHIPTPVTMRVSPAVSMSMSGLGAITKNFSNSGTSLDITETKNANLTSNGIRIQFFTAGSLEEGNSCAILPKTDDGYLDLSADL